MDIKTIQQRINDGIKRGLDLYQVDNNGFLIGNNIIESDQTDTSGYRDYFKYRNNIKRVPVQPVIAIIEHSTAGKNIGGALNTGRGDKIPGTHFYINRKGEIFQAVSLLERTSHINNTTHRTNRLDVNTSNSIGIENVRMWYNGKGWDELTPEQEKANIKLVTTLMVAYDIPKNNVLAHENIQHKTAGEGKEILDKIDKYLV